MSDFLHSLALSASGLKAQAARLRHVSENIANADTPGYRARDVASFAESYDPGPASALQATRPGHRFQDEMRYSAALREVYRPGAQSPNGNNVSIENEIFSATEASSDHNKALAVYRTALSVLRTAASAK